MFIKQSIGAIALMILGTASQAEPFRLIVTHLQPPLVPHSIMDLAVEFGYFNREGVDVDYLFLQVFVDQPIVTDAQNCGNILAGVAPFAIERDLVVARDGGTPVTIFMENTGQTAVVLVTTPGGVVDYYGEAKIDGAMSALSAISLLAAHPQNYEADISYWVG